VAIVSAAITIVQLIRNSAMLLLTLAAGISSQFTGGRRLGPGTCHLDGKWLLLGDGCHVHSSSGCGANS
jgi:hypothetical protein